MNGIEIVLISLGLSMDAAAVSMSNGMCNRHLAFRRSLQMALFFGLFQGIMPILGYIGGKVFSDKIAQVDHYVALILLCAIGGKMLYEALFGNDEEEEVCTVITTNLLIIQAVATSIDALAVGVSFAALKLNIIVAAFSIASITFFISLISVFIGKKFGSFFNKKAEIFGGLILIFIGFKIFIEHMGF